MGFLQILELLFTLAPKVISVIQAVETAVPQPNAGVQKLNAVLSTVTAAAAIAPQVTGATGEVLNAVTHSNVDAITTGLTHMINAFVALFNATGVFQKAGIVQAAKP